MKIRQSGYAGVNSQFIDSAADAMNFVGCSVTQTPYSLCAQSESCTGDGGRQVESLCDFSPDLLVDNFHQASLFCHQLVQHVQIQDLLGHDWDTIDWGSYGGEETIKEINMVQIIHPNRIS